MVMNMLNGPRLNWHQFLSQEIFWDVWTEKKLLLKRMSRMRKIISGLSVCCSARNLFKLYRFS